MNAVPQIQDVSFDDEATRVMGAAFDLACAFLRKSGMAVTVQELVALRIIEVAKAGERNPTCLCREALKELGIDTASMSIAA